MTSQRGIVYVPFGPRAGDKLVLERGGSITIGRDEGCDLVLANDRELSKRHCQITWAGDCFELRALGKASETRVDGEPIRGEVDFAKHGSLLELGGTQLVCFHELGTAPQYDPTKRHRVRYTPVLERLAYELDAGLYAVLDLARDTRILDLVRQSADEARSLYDGLGGQVLDDVSPYLVKFERGSKLLRALVEEGWGEAWGVFFGADGSFASVRRHLRRFLMAEVEDSLLAMYFRFYDPRVLNEFVPIATLRQKGELFAEIRAFFAEKWDSERRVFDLVMHEPPKGPVLEAGGGDVSHP